jgi:AmpE protein
MKLLVVLLCLLSERFLIHSASSQRFSWFDDYFLTINNLIERIHFIKNPWIILTVIIVPITIPIVILYFLFHSVFFGILGLIISVIIFLYCLGPQNAFYPISESSPAVSNHSLIGNYFSQVNRQLFSVIFWYIIAGPVGVLVYRLITLSRDISVVSQQANQATDLIEWIPARISVLLFLLVGNFQRGFVLFVTLFFSRPELNSQILSDCGLQAVCTNESEAILLPVAESLVEQAAIVLLVLIALFTLAAWI